MESTFNLVKKNQINNFDYLINKIDYNQIKSFVDILLEYKEKNIHVLGIGKSSSIANYLSDIFKSLNLKSFYLNCSNLTHGDLGCVRKEDIVIIITKSGNTEEIKNVIDLIPSFKLQITCNKHSILSKYVDKTYIVPFKHEADLFFDIIPSNSTSNIITYLNFIINMFVERSNFQFNNYKSSHPSGDIGFKTKKIEEFVNNDVYICKNYNLSNDEIIELLLKSKTGIIFERDDIFYGILTTKDILSNFNIIQTKSIYDFINTNPIVLDDPNQLMIEKLNFIKNYKMFKFIPILKNKKCIGILDNSLLIDKI